MVKDSGEIEISFGSKLHYVDLVQDISEKITQMAGFDEDDRYWIGMSIRESVVNAIQHGNKLDENKKVELRFEIGKDRLTIFVNDEGEGFDESQLADPLDPKNLLRPSGRGIFYIRSFMDDVQYKVLPGRGLQLRMEKKLNHKKEGDCNEN